MRRIYEKLARKEDDGKVVARLLAIASALDGLTRVQAAKQAGMDRQTLADWVPRYNELGVEGLRDKPKGHPKRLLTPEQEEAIKARVLEGPDPEKDGLVRWRCVDIAAFILEKYKITMHKRTVAKLLKRLGLSHISVRPQHPKSDSEAQDTFKKTSPPQWQAKLPHMLRVSPSKSGFACAALRVRTKPASDKKAP